MKSELRAYLPPIYAGVRETDALTEAGDALFDDFFAAMDRAHDDQFILRASEPALAAYEGLLGIRADGRALDFRRERALHRRRSRPPFTLAMLRARLDDIIGKGLYTLRVEGFTLLVETAVLDQAWAQELSITMQRIKPANMVYVNNPAVFDGIACAEGISRARADYQYGLAGGWQLGERPFRIRGERGDVKMEKERSIQEAMLEDIGGFIAPQIDRVVLNDAYTVTDFEARRAEGNVVTLEYELFPGGGAPDVIEDVKVCRGERVWTHSRVNVAVTDRLLFTHTIRLEERA